MGKGRWYTHPVTRQPTFTNAPTDEELDEVYYDQVRRDAEEKARREAESQANMQEEQDEWDSDDYSAWA